MPAVWQASGTLLGALTTADVTPVIPAHATDDILICVTANRVTTNTCATPSGWTLLAGPIDATNWRSYVFWKRAASAAETNPLCDWTATSADKYAQVHTLRGAIKTGSPFAASSLAGDVTDPIVVAGVTSTAASQLIVAIGLGSDNASASVTVTSTDPASFTQRHFSTIATGADATGSFHDAIRATAGATGNVTLDHDLTMPAEAVLVAAILPEPLVGDNAYEDEVFADAPVFVASMEEASGNLTDLIGSKTGTANGTPTYGSAGPIAGKTAIDFAAVTDFFDFADHADLDLGDGPFSIELWFRRDEDTGALSTLLHKGTNGYMVILTAADQMTLDKVGLAGFLVGETGTTAADGVWRHWVITRSAAGAGNTLIYKDAVEGHTDSQPTVALADTTAVLRIGQEAASNRVGGALAYIALYKSVLSATRVAAHYDARNGRRDFAHRTAALQAVNRSATY